MANINHLLAAVGKVADAYAPYAPDPNDNDSLLNDNDPGSDDGDLNDDPRRYDPANDEAAEEHAEDEDQESDFRRRKPLGTVMLLQKLKDEAEVRFMTELEAENQAIVQRNAKLPPTREQQNRKRLTQLKLKTAKIQAELELDRQLKLEEKRYVEARMLQRKTNLTVAEKKAEAEDIRHSQIAFSTTCPEAHPDWRKQVAEEFRSKSVR
jgi:hypothetical protein